MPSTAYCGMIKLEAEPSETSSKDSPVVDLPDLSAEELDALLRVPSPVVLAPGGGSGLTTEVAHPSREPLS